MPRGVYDRSKSKEQREGEKAGKIPKVKLEKKGVGRQARQASPAVGGQAVARHTDEYQSFMILQQYFNTLVSGRAALTGDGLSSKEISNELSQTVNTMKTYRERLWPITEGVVETKNGTQGQAQQAIQTPAPAPAFAAAPAPFNTPAS